jgi:DNA processing protein
MCTAHLYTYVTIERMSSILHEQTVAFPQLREIPQPPKKLYSVGTIPPLDHKLITIVGSRKFSTYGKMACEHLIAGLRGHPVSIVSGLAIGIDTIAHTAALEHNVHTIAVPGSGLGDNVLYPASNRRLAQRIVQQGGLLLSEFEPDFKATVWSFPQRNRIMAGLSHAVLIIEANEKSGTLITARMALDYNKTVLAVPGSIFDNSTQGTNKLIQQGATPVTTSEDILEALGIEPHNADSIFDTSELSQNERIVVEILTEPLSRDELMRLSSLNSSDTSATLTLLEIKGIIKESGGKIFRL